MFTFLYLSRRNTYSDRDVCRYHWRRRYDVVCALRHCDRFRALALAAWTLALATMAAAPWHRTGIEFPRRAVGIGHRALDLYKYQSTDPGHFDFSLAGGATGSPVSFDVRIVPLAAPLACEAGRAGQNIFEGIMSNRSDNFVCYLIGWQNGLQETFDRIQREHFGVVK